MANVKGTADFWGQSQIIRRQVQAVLEQWFQRYDFQPMETAILNEYDILSSKYGGGDEILQEMYSLSDQHGRRLGLRYDLTLPFAKVLAFNPAIQLRNSGIRTRMEYRSRRPKNALASASRQHIRYAILIGESESSLGQVTLKDLEQRTEALIPLEQAIMIIEKT